MSFILDALKKSEAERQRKSIPGFADIADARNEPRPRGWLWVVGILLTVNLAVLIVVFFRPGKPQAPQPVAAQPAQEAPAVRHEEPVRPAFSEIVAEARKNHPEQDRPTTTEPQRPKTATAVTPKPRATITEAVTTLNELRADGTLQLPELHLDIHVYSEQPSERFVFINMSKYKEKASLSEGPVVEEITPDGVVLEHRGTRFLLPRQ